MWCLRHAPELWRGAAGLCARVRACAGAAESLHTHIVRHTSIFGDPAETGEATAHGTWAIPDSVLIATPWIQ